MGRASRLSITIDNVQGLDDAEKGLRHSGREIGAVRWMEITARPATAEDDPLLRECPRASESFQRGAQTSNFPGALLPALPLRIRPSLRAFLQSKL